MRPSYIGTAFLLGPSVALAFDPSLFRRHGDEPHGNETSEHGHENSSGDQGVGHGHSMSHGAFNFTPSGIEWPTCLRDCCNAFFDFFPEPVNHPLCVSDTFYNNVTSCVVQNCTEYEQGAYTVVVPVECPTNQTLNATAVTSDLEAVGGKPQSCEGVDNSTIQCNNATDSGTNTSGGVSFRTSVQGAWLLSTAIIALPVLAMVY